MNPHRQLLTPPAFPFAWLFSWQPPPLSPLNQVKLDPALVPTQATRSGFPARPFSQQNIASVRACGGNLSQQVWGRGEIRGHSTSDALGAACTSADSGDTPITACPDHLPPPTHSLGRGERERWSGGGEINWPPCAPPPTHTLGLLAPRSGPLEMESLTACFYARSPCLLLPACHLCVPDWQEGSGSLR